MAAVLAAVLHRAHLALAVEADSDAAEQTGLGCGSSRARAGDLTAYEDHCSASEMAEISVETTTTTVAVVVRLDLMQDLHSSESKRWSSQPAAMVTGMGPRWLDAMLSKADREVSL